MEHRVTLADAEPGTYVTHVVVCSGHKNVSTSHGCIWCDMATLRNEAGGLRQSLEELEISFKTQSEMYDEATAALTTAREENERLTAENANLRAAVAGKTFFHSDEDANAEMGRLRVGHVSLVKELRLTRLALDEERERCARIAINQAEAIRVANTYRGKVNQMADQAAFWCEQIAAEIINPPNPVITIPNTEQPST